MKPIIQNEIRDEFLSEEDLDLRNLSIDEVTAYWETWFAQAQATNDADRWSYSHGVFEEVPPCARSGAAIPHSAGDRGD